MVPQAKIAVAFLALCVAGALAAETFFIGGIFELGSENSPEFAAFNLAMDQLERSAGGWQSHLGPRPYRYTRLIEYVVSAGDPLEMSRALCSLAARGVLAILGPSRQSSISMVQSVTDDYEILYLTVGPAHRIRPDRVVHKHRVKDLKLSRLLGRYVFRVRPPVILALTGFIRLADWRKLHYLLDSRAAELRLRELFEAFGDTPFGLSVDIREAHDPSGVEAALKHVKDRAVSDEISRVVLDLGPSNLAFTLREISRHRMEGTHFAYLLHGTDINEVSLTPFDFGGVNLTGFSVLNLTDPLLQSFRTGEWLRYPRRPNKTADEQNFLPLSAALVMDALEALVRSHVRTPRSQAMPRMTVGGEVCVAPMTPQFRAADMAEALKAPDFEFAGFSGPVRFNSSGYRSGYRVQIFQSGEKFPAQQISEWSRGHIVVKQSRLSKLGKNSRHPRNNKTRVVTSILAEPFMMRRSLAVFDGTPIIGNDRFEGFCVDLARLVAERVGFNYVMKPVSDGRYGDDSVNKTWNGMIGELFRHEADIAVAPLTITSKREKVVDFSKPYMEVGLSIMFMKPTKPMEEVFGFMKPLSKEIWMCIAFAYLSVSVVLFVVSRLSPYEWRVKQDSDKMTNDFSIFNSLWFSLSAFMQQGGDISPRSLSGRIVGSVWWFFTLIIVSSYTANLAAFLTVERMATPIQSYEDLARQTKIKYGVVNSGASKDFFKESKIQDFRRMWQFMESHPEVFVNSVSDGVERVRKSNRDYAFLLESTMNEYYNQQNCDTMKVGGNLDSGKGYGIATPTGSELRESINVAVLILKEKNDIHMLYKKWWEDRFIGNCPADDSGDAKKSVTYNSLHLSDVQGLFFILGAGVVMGLFLSVMEFVYRCALLAKRRRSRRAYEAF